jgi:hypothetical protein
MNTKTLLLAAGAFVAYNYWKGQQAANTAGGSTSTTPVMALAITGAAIYAAYHYGPPEVKGMALGAAGAIAINQIPVVRDGLGVRLVA